mmetsp:Transcript_109236/g.216943  ORF Transcript_109236/g.216943 Transcript_109236/m.216943 type:complete len:399 (+) Transcript_109236:66-1262(+)
MPCISPPFVLLLCLWFAPAEARVEKRLFAIPDVHGDLDALQGALRLAGVQFENVHTSAGQAKAKTHVMLPPNSTLVFLGDLVDRGPAGPACYAQLVELAKAAARNNSSSHVVRLLGNHEWLNLLGVDRRDNPNTPYVQEDLLASYVHPQELDELNGWHGRGAAFRPNGSIAEEIQREFRILALLPAPWHSQTAEQLPPVTAAATLFLHGGITASTAHRYASAAELDAEARQQLHRWGLHGDSTLLLPGRPPHGTELFNELLQERMLAYGPSSTVCPELRSILAHFGAARLVLGHTPQLGGNSWGEPQQQRRAGVHCDGRLILMDVAMSRWLLNMRRPEKSPHPAVLELSYLENLDAEPGDTTTSGELTGLRVLYGSAASKKHDLLPPFDSTSSAHSDL